MTTSNAGRMAESLNQAHSAARAASAAERLEVAASHAESDFESLRSRTKDSQHLIAPVLSSLLNQQSALIYHFMTAQGFWRDRRERGSTASKIALMHSELSEALEADRKGLQSEVIPGLSGVAEELADTVIRVLDYCGAHGIDLGAAIAAKMQVNLNRPYKHGKAY